MGAHAEALERLREAGYRLTPQRVMVLGVLGEGRGHLGTEEIYKRVRRTYPFFDLATLYRTLHLLAKLHLVAPIEGPGETRYELVRQDQPHHHMVCEECGTAFDLPPRYLEAFKASLAREVGFEPHLEHFTIQGLCGQCTARGVKKGEE